MKSEGWISADILLASLVTVILLTSMVTVIEERIDTANSISQAVEARILGENLAETIESTYIGGEGFSTTYQSPRKISNQNYIVVINSSGLCIYIDGKFCYTYLTLMRISGSNYPTEFKVIIKPDKTYNITNVKDYYNMTRIVIKEI